MSASIAPFVVSLIYTDRLRRYAKVTLHPQWEKLFRYAQFFSAFLFLSEVILSGIYVTRWIFHAYLIALIYFSFRQKELRVLRMFMAAFVPYVVVSFVSDLAEAMNADFFQTG